MNRELSEVGGTDGLRDKEKLKGLKFYKTEIQV